MSLGPCGFSEVQSLLFFRIGVSSPPRHGERPCGQTRDRPTTAELLASASYWIIPSMTRHPHPRDAGKRASPSVDHPVWPDFTTVPHPTLPPLRGREGLGGVFVVVAIGRSPDQGSGVRGAPWALSVSRVGRQQPGQPFRRGSSVPASKARQHFKRPHIPDDRSGVRGNFCAFTILTDTGGNPARKLRQHNARPHGPHVPARRASSRGPIRCRITRMRRSRQRSRNRSRKSTFSSDEK